MANNNEATQVGVAMTKDETADAIQSSTTNTIGLEKTEKSIKPPGWEIIKSDPNSITDLFERLCRATSRAYYERLGTPVPIDLETKIKAFAERAASHPVLGRAYFLSQEQTAVEAKSEAPLTASDHQEIASLAAAARRTMKGGDKSQPVAAASEKAMEPALEATHDLDQEISAAPLEKIVLQAYEKMGMRGVDLLREQMGMHFNHDLLLRAQLERQIEAIIRKLNLDQGGKIVVSGLPERLTGSFEEVALQATMLLKQHVGNARYAQALAAGPLAAALEEMENMGLARDRQVDLMIHAFAGEPVYHDSGTQPPCTKQFCQFLARLCALVLSEISEQPTPGQLETLVNLTTWYGQAKETACRACGTELALETLPHFYTLREEPARVAKMMQQLTNNAAGWLSDLLGFRGDEETMDRKTDQAGWLNTLHALGCVAFLHQETGDAWNEKAKEVFNYLDVDADEKVAGSMARAFLYMSNIPTAWRILGRLFPMADGQFADATRRLRTAVLALISALMRARFNPRKDHDEISQALFNLGVDINIHSRKLTESDQYLPLRILANTLGLWWALMRANDEGQAIGPFHGGDCAVNLFGALTEKAMESLCGAHEQSIRSLGDVIHGQMAGNVDALRLSNSYKEMFNEEPRAGAILRRQEAAQALAGLLSAFLADWKCDEASDLHQRLDAAYEETTAKIMNWAFSRTKGGENVYRACLAGWLAVAGGVVELATASDYAAFQGQIPDSLEGWGVKSDCERSEVPLDIHTLSHTLRDTDLMRGVFGLVRG